jgi:hypothetical protein
MFDELPNVSVGIRDPETANAGALNLDYNDNYYSPMNAVSTQRLIVKQAIDLPCFPTGLPRCLGRANAP